MRRAVFFDRDGVLNKLIERHLMVNGQWKVLLTSPWVLSEFEVYHGIRSIVNELQREGYLAIIATNQPGLANENELSESVYECMCAQLRQLGFDDIFTCRHKLDSTCKCRKPEPGLLTAAAEKWDIDLSASYFVGDNESDLEAARRAGCHGILLRTLHNSDVRAKHEIGMLGRLPRIIRDLSLTPA